LCLSLFSIRSILLVLFFFFFPTRRSSDLLVVMLLFLSHSFVLSLLHLLLSLNEFLLFVSLCQSIHVLLWFDVLLDAQQLIHTIFLLFVFMILFFFCFFYF